MLKYSGALDGTKLSQDILELPDRSESCYEVLEEVVDFGEDHHGILFAFNGPAYLIKETI